MESLWVFLNSLESFQILLNSFLYFWFRLSFSNFTENFGANSNSMDFRGKLENVSTHQGSNNCSRMPSTCAHRNHYCNDPSYRPVESIVSHHQAISPDSHQIALQWPWLRLLRQLRLKVSSFFVSCWYFLIWWSLSNLAVAFMQ